MPSAPNPDEPSITGRFDHAPISRLMGFQVQPGAAGHAEVLLDTSDLYHNPMGQVHGGVISAIADAAMGIAFGRTLTAEQQFSTVDLSVQFIRPIRQGLIRAEAAIVERGLRVGFVRCSVTSERNRKLLATANCTCMIAADW